MMENVTIQLLENTMRGRAPRDYTRQTVYIEHEAPTSSRGVDGGISPANHPSTIRWIGGLAADLEEVTDVKIIDSAGHVILEAALCRHTFAPRSLYDGVIFQVLKDD